MRYHGYCRADWNHLWYCALHESHFHDNRQSIHLAQDSKWDHLFSPPSSQEINLLRSHARLGCRRSGRCSERYYCLCGRANLVSFERSHAPSRYQSDPCHGWTRHRSNLPTRRASPPLELAPTTHQWSLMRKQISRDASALSSCPRLLIMASFALPNKPS